MGRPIYVYLAATDVAVSSTLVTEEGGEQRLNLLLQ